MGSSSNEKKKIIYPRAANEERRDADDASEECAGIVCERADRLIYLIVESESSFCLR